MSMVNTMQRLRQVSLPVVVLAAVTLLQACSAIQLEEEFQINPRLHARVIDQDRDLFPDVDPLYLSDEIKELVDTKIGNRASDEIRVRRLQELLFGENQLNLSYTDLKTHTAVEAFAARAGNCLSAMNLYVAMARYAGLDANFQTVAVQPTWDLRGNLLVLNQHINATGRVTVRRHYVVDFAPEVALQQLTARVISDQQARSLYFNNLGVEALVAGEPEKALAYFKNSLYLDDELQYAWNNIGSTYSMMGEQELAEYSFQMGFYFDHSNATAINNLARLYSRRGDSRLARQYAVASLRFNERNPYYHYSVGQQALDVGDLPTALESLRRAIRLKSVEPAFFTALGTTYEQLGDSGRAQEMRERANELIALNGEMYQPSDQKLRIIDTDTILRDSSPGLSIVLPTGTSSLRD